MLSMARGWTGRTLLTLARCRCATSSPDRRRWPPTVWWMNVVLLHALPLDGTMWPDEARLPGHRVMAPTLYRLGDTIQQWASAVLDLADPGPLVVVGNSVGGSCA